MTKIHFDPSNKFIDPERVLFAAGLTAGQTVADFGAGSGYYTFAAGKIVGDQGSVLAVDVLEATLEHVSAEARLKGLRNIRTVRADLEQENSLATVPSGSVDMVVFANILHQIKNQKSIMAQAYRLLKTGGKLVLIEWNQSHSPIGPPAIERIHEADAVSTAGGASFKPAGTFATDSYHYGLMFIK